MTNEALADKLGISRSMASRIRNGQRLPGVATILALYREFNISPLAMLLAYTEGPAVFGRLVSNAVDKP
jgi:transcriptional regulator with XRE-family HTH domain